MKRKLLIISGLVVVVAFAAWLYIFTHTHHYVSTSQEQVSSLEALLEHAFERVGQNAISNAEASQLHFQVLEHLDSVNNYHPAVGLVGYTEEHESVLKELIEKLKELLETHRSVLIALETATTTGDVQVIEPDNSGTVDATTSIDAFVIAIDTLSNHLAYASN